MLKDVTLGRYYDAKSALHKLDPRTKLFCTLVYIVSTFIVDKLILCVFSFVFLALIIIISKVPVRYMLRGLRPVIIIVIITDLINIFFVKDAINKALLVTLRMFEIVLFSNLLSLTTKPKDIASGIEKALGFLNYFKIPVHDFATMISISFRFIPILTQEADRIMEAQKARGADFESKNMISRAKSLMPILIPLFVSAFRRADELALAMDSRLYGLGRSSRLYPLYYKKADFISYLITIIYLALVIYLKEMGL